MVAVHTLLDEKVVGRRARCGVQIASNNHRDLCAVCDLLQAFEKGVNLPELDIGELWVRVNVGVGHAHEVTPSVTRTLLKPLKNQDKRDVVLQQPV